MSRRSRRRRSGSRREVAAPQVPSLSNVDRRRHLRAYLTELRLRGEPVELSPSSLHLLGTTELNHALRFYGAKVRGEAEVPIEY